jgi:DNA repair protein RecN (Recombination protein N)
MTDWTPLPSALAIDSHDVAGELRDYGQAADAEELAGGELALEQIEERLAMIERLVRKHGGSIRAVREYAERARARREQLAGAEQTHARTAERLSEARAALAEHVRALRVAREAAAPSFALAVREQLATLEMGDATFEVVLSERDPGPRGADSVEFMIAPNPGVPAGPLREIASGGELSRIMLAIMSVASAPSADVTLVFDEVDAGISGHTARAVGARLRELGTGRQVLCITHLPQIASLGERHFSIAKDTTANPTRATVAQLADREVVSELVRMLGGEAGDTGARRHARDLRRAA